MYANSNNMQYLRQKLGYFASMFVRRSNDNVKELEETRNELYYEYIYRVLYWQNTTFTLVVFLVLNFIFWLIVQWQLKFFGIIFVVILSAFLWDSYCELKGVTSNRGQYSEAVDDIYGAAKDIVFNLKLLRQESPSSFCIGMSLIFLAMSFIARNISGYILFYLALLALFFIPLGIKYLPEEYFLYLKHVLKSVGTSKGVLAEDELIPFISNKDFTRKDTDLDSLLTDKTADSATNSLVSGISAMPSYLDVTESRDGIEEDDLIPKNIQGRVSFTPGELSSDSDSEHREIHFDSTHFNGDTSSEDENLTKGLRFTSDIHDDSIQTSKPVVDIGLTAALSNFVAIGGNLVANVLKSTVSGAPTERKNSSSDSEFEVINSDDIDLK